MTTSHTIPTVELDGVQFHALTERQCVDHIVEELQAGRGGWVVTPNLEILRRAKSDTHFKSLVDQANIVVADGMPLIWASRLACSPLPQRVAGSSLIHTLTEQAAQANRSVYLLGGDAGTAEEAAAFLTAKHPTLRVVGTSCPTVHAFDEESLREIRTQLVRSQPDIVYVGLGCPKQENLIAALRSSLPHTWWLGIGVSFSFVCGRVRRAPPWMQKLGLEWLHRLGQEPRRLAYRYLVQGLPFAFSLLVRSFYRGLLRTPSGIPS